MKKKLEEEGDKEEEPDEEKGSEQEGSDEEDEPEAGDKSSSPREVKVKILKEKTPKSKRTGTAKEKSKKVTVHRESNATLFIDQNYRENVGVASLITSK